MRCSSVDASLWMFECPFGGGQVANSRRVSSAALLDGLDWQERGELIGGGGREAGESLFQPGRGIHTGLLAGGGEARQDRQSAAAVIVAEKEPVAAADGIRLDGLSIIPSLLSLFMGCL